MAAHQRANGCTSSDPPLIHSPACRSPGYLYLSCIFFQETALRKIIMAEQHHYALTAEWTGNTGAGTTAYRAYERSYTINADGKPEGLLSPITLTKLPASWKKPLTAAGVLYLSPYIRRSRSPIPLWQKRRMPFTTTPTSFVLSRTPAISRYTMNR